jgi:rSAM/selenodomain-associated transferase 1
MTGGRLTGLHILVMAKAPVAGRVKTRLCPPCTPEQAAALAEAALADTLDAVVACGAARRVIALDGEPGAWLPEGFEVVPQASGDFDVRLAGAWAAAGGAGVQIGMDTPQVTAALLDDALASLDRTAAALGHAEDGGWWAIGLRQPSAAVFAGIPMSTSGTGAAQERRLRSLGFSVTLLPTLVDLDTAADLAAVTSSGTAIRTASLARTLGMAPASFPLP